MEKCNKIVIFDWGGVIENNNQSYYNISKAIIDIMRKYKCKLTDQEILEVCTNGGKLFNTFIDDDEQTTIDWFNEIKGKLNIDCNYDEYKNAYYEYGKKIPYHKDVVKFAHSLRDKCYIAMFSSLVKLDEARINEQVNLSLFDYIFLTYKMGFAKPDSKAFEYIENTVKINPENILFIDDTQINIDEANKRKWKTCRADGFELKKIKRSVEDFLEKGEINGEIRRK